MVSNMEEIRKELLQNIGSLLTVSLKIAAPVSQLHQIREKILTRGYQPFDKPDVLDQLGCLQQINRELNKEMLHVHDVFYK